MGSGRSTCVAAQSSQRSQEALAGRAQAALSRVRVQRCIVAPVGRASLLHVGGPSLDGAPRPGWRSPLLKTLEKALQVRVDQTELGEQKVRAGRKQLRLIPDSLAWIGYKVGA